MSDSQMQLVMEDDQDKDHGVGGLVDESEHPDVQAEEMMAKDDSDKVKAKEKEDLRKKNMQTHNTERQLMPSVPAVPIMPAVIQDGTQLAMHDSMVMQKGMAMGNFGGNKMTMQGNMEEEPRKGKRRRIYQTDEERRMARILKNRRTAEESRQRRLQKMKELEAHRNGADEREQKLRWELSELREELQQRNEEISRLKEENEKLRESSLSAREVLRGSEGNDDGDRPEDEAVATAEAQ